MAHQRVSTRDEDDIEGLTMTGDLESKSFNPFDNDDDNDAGKSVNYTGSSDYWADLILARYRGL